MSNRDVKPEKIFLAPIEGGRVRDPLTRKPLPVEGAWKPRTRFWLRRLADGSCVEIAPPKKSKPEKTKES